MSTFTSVQQWRDEDGTELDVAHSRIEECVRVAVDGPETAIFLTPTQAREMAAELLWAADRAVAGAFVRQTHFNERNGEMACGVGLYSERMSTSSWENVSCRECLKRRP